MKLQTIFLAAALTAVCAGAAETKEQSIERMRRNYAKQTYHGYSMTRESLQDCLRHLQNDGTFDDYAAKEAEIAAKNYAKQKYSAAQYAISDVTGPAFGRMWKIAEQFRKKPDLDPELKKKLFKAIVHYGNLEHNRLNVSPRFHNSCFHVPQTAVNLYFCFYTDMQAVEAGQNTDPLTNAVHKILLDVVFQCWDTPARGDATDQNVVSIDRFRKHVWWVGGNALSYRPVLQAALVRQSEKMIDVLAVVSKSAISPVSQNTYDQAFWTEGFTADGAGWGHGKQCLIWGYPVQGINSALGILNELQGSPWAAKLERPQIDAILNFLRGSAFYHYKGWIPPALDRNNMDRNKSPKAIPALGLAKNLLNNWNDSLTEAEKAELTRYVQEAEACNITMEDQPDGFYHGSRYFFNNDDMITRTTDYHVFINMASVRCDGLESAFPGAAGFNFFTADGATFFQKKGNEYQKIIGAMRLSAWPGITARAKTAEYKPITNWLGFSSRHNFAAGATSGKDFAAGFLFEKVDGKDKPGMKKDYRKDPNATIFGVRANKSYFLFGKTLLALGCGISNLMPELPGNIETSINQTFLDPNGSTVSAKGLDWQLNGGFAYAVLPAHTTGTVSVKREQRQTNWAALCRNNKAPEETVGVFEMVIDHGKKPENGKYAYLVALDGNPETPLPTILANTPALQAAESADGKTVGAVFFNARSVLKTSRGTVRVSSPCALLLEYDDDAKTAKITVTDAEMNAKLAGIKVLLPGKTAPETVPMPQGHLCGKPATITVSL